ncbi:MAG TPA: GntR family transcriptional regulator [Selenomonadales bacterium]|nr:GntR family transcriptional regulator [Selenomonadales bacterium]
MMKTQQAYEFIRSRILDSTYRPGDRIVIDRVAAELNLSIIPVREAIRQLEADGFVQTIPYSGAVVQLMDDTDYEETQWVLALLDGGATSLAALAMTPQDIEELEALNKAMQQALDDLEFAQFGELNRKFHDTIYQRCGNTYLIDRLRLTWQRLAQVRKAVFSFVPRRAKESIAEHEELIQLFKAAAPPEKIEEFARQHKLKMLYAVKQRKKTM